MLEPITWHVIGIIGIIATLVSVAFAIYANLQARRAIRAAKNAERLADIELQHALNATQQANDVLELLRATQRNASHGFPPSAT